MNRVFVVLITLSSLLLPEVSCEPCKLCREDANRKGDKRCFRDSIQYRVIELQRPPMDVMVTMSLDASAKNGNCSVVVVGPGDSPINATVTADSRTVTSIWGQMRFGLSAAFIFNQAASLSINPHKEHAAFDEALARAEAASGAYSVHFADGESVDFYVYMIRKLIPVMPETGNVITEESNNYTKIEFFGEPTDFRHCRTQRSIPRKVMFQCDGKRLCRPFHFSAVETAAIETSNGSLVNATKWTLYFDSGENAARDLRNITVQCLVLNFGGVFNNETLIVSQFLAQMTPIHATAQTSYYVLGAVLAMALVASVSYAGIYRKRRNNTRHRKRERTTSCSYVQGPRIIIPADSCALNFNDDKSETEEHRQNPIRPRLESILSFFSSSTRSRSSSSTRTLSTNSNEMNAEALLPMIPLKEHSWIRERLFDFSAVQKENVVLGEGEFGLVYKAMVLDGAARWPVALKLANTESESAQEELLTEGAMMAGLKYHPNIANLQGVAFNKAGKFHLMIEYCGNGSLLKFLKAKRESLREELMEVKFSGGGGPQLRVFIGWSLQIAKGMEYLAENGVIHGDLAARNVLLTDDLIAKISDFGLANRFSVEDKSASLRQEKLPQRWLAPEIFERRKLSTSSDVWSFGIVLWEIFELGKMPYQGMAIEDVLTSVNGGARLPCPEFCPKEIYALMTEGCWPLRPEKRADFAHLASELEPHLDSDFSLKFQESREEMLKRYARIQQNRMYFNMTPSPSLKTKRILCENPEDAK